MRKVHGVGLSPFVRKVRVVMAEKGLDYELIPVIPVNVSDEYKKISPLGKIPCYEEDGWTLPDSSAICAYLERAHSTPAVYPSGAREYGTALWFEEYADSAMVAVVGGKIFFPRVVAPRFFNQPADEAAVQKAIDEELPPLFNYLEASLKGGTTLVGDQFSIADIAVTSQFVNLKYAQVSPDAARWPKLAAYVAANMERPSFQKLIAEESAALG